MNTPGSPCGPLVVHRGGVVAAVRSLRAGGVIAYPTEAVYGLGCDPDQPVALARLLSIKQRSADKGFILIAADEGQLARYVDLSDAPMAARVRATWPGPVTWLLPARPGVSTLLRGAHTRLAVRITAHPLAARLCRAFGGALVSTSANIQGQSALHDGDAVVAAFGEAVDFTVEGAVGGQARPSAIRDAVTGALVRPG